MNTALLPFALLCTLLYAGLAIHPFSPSGIGWNDGLALLSARLTVSDVDPLSVWLAAIPGFAWLGAVWPRKSAARFAATAGVFIGLILAFLLLNVGQIVYTSRQVSYSAPLASGFGILIGIGVWWMIGTRLPRVTPPAAWPVLALIALLPLLLPWDATMSSASLDSYFKAFPERVYFFIKSALIWVPVGFLFSVSGRHDEVPRWGIAWALALVLEALPMLGGQQPSDILALIFSLPGVWLGAWLGHATALILHVEATSSARVAVPVSMQPAHPTPPPRQPAPVPTELAPETQSTRIHSRLRAGKPVRSHTHPLRIITGISLLATVGLSLSGFPLFWSVAIAGCLALYAVVLWLWPTLWLVLVPAALPLLDLAPWTGRFFLDEFDLLILATAGTLWLRGRNWPSARLTPMWPFFTLCVTGLLISLLLGLGSPPPLDANAFSSYWSPYNSLRVAKGFAWGGVLFMLLRLRRPDPGQLASHLALGMGIGLLGVGLVGLWERWLFAGFVDDAHPYRIVSTFSSMHTGGGHIEAYLAAALPFLWLGMANWKTRLLAIPVMALTVYVTIFTVARGGVLALAVVLLTLGVASLRLAWRSGQRRKAVLPIAVLTLLAAGLLAGIGGNYFQKRLATIGEDWQTRVDHWRGAASMMDESPTAQLFGMGLGSFPRRYLERGPVDKQPATFGFLFDKDNTFLRLGSGDTLYYAQRVAVRAGEKYHLELDARGRQDGARIETPVCEKQLLNSRRCVWIALDVPGDGRWHRLSHDVFSGEVGIEDGLRRPPVELFLYYPGKTGQIDVDNVRLIDTRGANLLANGGFSSGGDYWFFKTHSHLPWHIKNVWVHVLFEQGWLGLSLFTALVAYALIRLARKAWSGAPLAWAWLAALLGLLTVGMFDSLFDAPRLATLLTLLCLLGVAYDWDTKPLARHRKKHHSRQSHHPDERLPIPETTLPPEAENLDQASTPSAR